MTQPEVFRMADHLESRGLLEEAAELRRLHTLLEAEQALHQRTTYPELRRLSSENELLHQRHHDDNVEYTRVLTQRDVLLEALRKIGRYTGEGPTHTTPWQDIVADLGQTARAAIKAVEGEGA